MKEYAFNKNFIGEIEMVKLKGKNAIHLGIDNIEGKTVEDTIYFIKSTKKENFIKSNK